MLLLVAAALASLTCVLASAARLRVAIAPTELDPKLLAEALSRGSDRELMERIASQSNAGWERDLFLAAAAPDPRMREAAIDEQVHEMDALLERHVRTPRVAASVSTSLGFMCACLVVIQATGGEGFDGSLSGGPLILAIDCLALGLVGTGFSAAVHVRARRAVQRARLDVDRLVDRVRARIPEHFPAPSQ